MNLSLGALAVISDNYDNQGFYLKRNDKMIKNNRN